MAKRAQLRKTREELARARAGLDREIDRTAMTRARRSWDTAAAELVASVASLKREVSPVMLAARVPALAVKFSVAVGRELVALTKGTLMTGAETIFGWLARLVQRDRFVDAPHVRQALVAREAQLADMRRRSAASLGRDVGASLRASLLTATSTPATAMRPREMAAMLEGALDGQWWRAARIVATETAHAFNAAQEAVLVKADVPGLMQRWTEKIDDSGRPLDRRVAIDSMVMHGQLTVPGGLFVMPPWAADRGVPGGLLGRAWPFPPNRPHDRAILTPWLPAFGVSPGVDWRLIDGRRVSV